MKSFLSVKKIKSNYWIYILSISGLIIPNIAFAIMEWLGQMLAYIIYFLYIFPLGLVLKLELWILPMIAQYNNFINEAGVITGWIVLRDLSNMLFIIVFLIMAFATILKIQSYGYQQILKRFLILAILINFSKTIVGFVIDFFQIVMLTFVDAIKDIAAGNVVAGLGIGTWDQFTSVIDNASQSGFFAIVASAILLAIMMLITVIVMGMFIVALTMRIVQIWIYIVLSPLAFFAYTFPGGQKYFNDWISKLSKQLLIGPFIAFFLWLSFTIVGHGNINESIDAGSATNAELEDLSAATQPNQMINFIIGISMLIASLKIAQELGAAGAAGASGLVGKLKGAATAPIKRKDMSMGRATVYGTSGEGGIKAVAGRTKAGFSGAGVSITSKLAKGVSGSKFAGTKFGKYAVTSMTGTAERAQMRALGQERLRMGRKSDVITQQASDAGIGKGEMSTYLEKQAVSGLGTNLALAKGRIQNPREISKMSDDELFHTSKTLEEGGDKEGLDKLRFRRADSFSPENFTNGEEGAQEAANDYIDRGRDDDNLFKGLSKDSIVNKEGPNEGEPTAGAVTIATAALENPNLSSKDIIKSLDKLDKPIADALRKAFAKVPIKTDNQTLGQKKKDGSETAAGKKAVMDLNGKDANEVYKNLLPQAVPKLQANATPVQKTEHKKQKKRYEKEKKILDKRVSSVVTSKSAGKMDKESDVFKAAVGTSDGKKVSELLKEFGSDGNKIKILVEAQIKNGNDTSMKNNPVTANTYQQIIEEKKPVITKAADDSKVWEKKKKNKKREK